MATPQGGAQPLSPKITNMQTEKDATIIFGSVDEEVLRAENVKNNKKTGPSQQADKISDNHGRTDSAEDRPKITSNTCKPIAAERPRIELPGQMIDEHIQYMRDHALIGKFIGFWPTEKALRG